MTGTNDTVTEYSQKVMAGTLYLIPSPLGSTDCAEVPSQVLERLRVIDYLVVENAKAARAFLIALGRPRSFDEYEIVELRRDDVAHAQELLKPVMAGRDVGLLSDAGSPCVADPGALVVAAAHECGIEVSPLVGPSSIILGLMGSGLNGQSFAFHGYLPRDEGDRRAALRALERESLHKQQTQIFIETPYRNDVLLASMFEVLSDDTQLCVATELTQPEELIQTRKIANWKSSGFTIGKRPAVFLLQA